MTSEDPDAAAVDRAFDRALDLEGPERERFLAGLDPARRRPVRELLEVAARGGPLDAELGELASHLIEADGSPGSAGPGRRIGAWRLVERLGAGGMGVVYRVRRAAGDFDQEAALKVIRWELAGPSLERRFREERRILAQLSHPNIAALVDGGVTETGLPYLVLEYVEGEPLDLYAERRELGEAEKLALIGALARAVDFAHRRLVVHRDLKPSNILVRDDGVLKLLDFGIAKLISETSSEVTRSAPMTPRYASPEQRRGAPASLASDIWSVGAVAAQLLTGRLPEETPLGDIRVPGVRGDLGNILGRALHTDPERRYRTALELAEDLDRWRNRRPVNATPPTLRYRFGRWLSRHRAVSAALLAAVLVGIAGVVGVLWQAREARGERDRARLEAARAEQMTTFLFDLFESTAPSLGEEPRVRDLLDRGVERIQSGPKMTPRSRSELLLGLGDAYKWLREYDRAEELIAEAVEIERSIDPGGARYGEALSALGGIYLLAGDSARAEATLRRALALLEAAGAEPSSRASVLNSLGMARQNRGDFEGAVEYLELSLGLAVQQGDARGRAMAHGNLGLAYSNLGRFESAETHHRSAARLYRESSPESSALGHVLNNLANTLGALGRVDEARETLEQVLEMQRGGTDLAPDIAVTEANLAHQLILAGQAAAAVELAERAAGTFGRFRPGSANAIANRANLGWALALEQDYPRALEILEAVVGELAERFGDRHRRTARGRTRYGSALWRAGRVEDAREQLEAAVQLFRAEGVGGVMLADALLPLGSLRCEAAELQEGLATLDRALGIFRGALASSDWRLALARVEKARCQSALGQPWDAASVASAQHALLSRRGEGSWEASRAEGLSPEP
ncbi:MAG: serine/threonine-protein kinase [Acidobacteriota bacterium]